jgi:hypothetical protein
MSKRVISPSSLWPGAVVLSSPLTLPLALAWEKAEKLAAPYRANIHKARADKLDWDIVDVSEIHNIYIPVIFDCVEKWELENMPEDLTAITFPGSPRFESIKLVGWLINSISAIYRGEEEKTDPNA